MKNIVRNISFIQQLLQSKTKKLEKLINRATDEENEALLECFELREQQQRQYPLTQKDKKVLKLFKKKQFREKYLKYIKPIIICALSKLIVEGIIELYESWSCTN